MKNKIYQKLSALSLVLLVFSACEQAYFPQPPRAKVAQKTSTLQAAYVSTPPMAITDAYWKTADFLEVPFADLTDLNKNELYANGFLNMTGTYGGKATFNKGADPKLVMKAAYDNSKLYLYMEWVDSDMSPALESAFFSGPTDPLKTDSAGGWTSQGNSDKIALAFEIANASSAAGTFSDKGCAASCHNNKMQPSAGSVDIWKWDLAISEPLGYAVDMMTDATTGISNDAGTSMATRNKVTPGNPRSGPVYEWDGTEQSYTRPDGKTTNLDPAFYLLNKALFTGDVHKGDVVYHHPTYGCNHCHGENGDGVGSFGEATAFASTGFAGKYSRSNIISFSGNEEHTGKQYWQQVPTGSYDDLIAYIKGLGSLPGHYLTTPTGSSANVWSVSNVTRSKVNVIAPHTVYKVLLVRDLSTGNPDDAQFTAPQGKSFPFGVALMDHDGKNHIGSLKQILTFQSK
jgi:mono/diheme cytochrome c family protein